MSGRSAKKLRRMFRENYAAKGSDVWSVLLDIPIRHRIRMALKLIRGSRKEKS